MPKKPISTKNNRKPASSKRQTRLVSFLKGRYGKPAALVFMFACFGAGTLYWASAATTTYSLWSNSTVPKIVTVNDTQAKELGVKFQAKVAGYVTGVRFYKGAQNTGTHIGDLWDSHGNLLSSVQFTNESASGWQTASFSQPVSIAANVTYVVSYYAPKGYYSLNQNYFKSGPHSKNYLTALQNTTTNSNGVYVNSASARAYPTVSGSGSNYWVDVVFSNKVVSPQPAPAAPTNVTATLQTGTSPSIVVNWSASVSANTITSYTIYRDGNKLAAVNGSTLTYTDSTVAAGNTYSYQVMATDSTNTNSSLSSSASVTIPTSSGSGGGGTGSTTTCPLPAYPNATCAGVPANTTLGTAAPAGVSTSSGDWVVTAAGAVIDSVHVTGSIVVKATGVTIKNSQIDGMVTNDGISGSSFEIDNSTVGTNTCSMGDVPVSLWGHDFVAKSVYLHGHGDAIDMGGSNVSVSDSYLQPCFLPGSIVGGDGYHTDGVQDLCDTSCGNLTLTHNTVDARAYYNGQAMGNSALNLGSSADGLHLTGNITLTNNLFMGGGYTTDLRWDAGPSIWAITGNAWVNGAWTYAPISTEGTCKYQSWSGNTLVTIGGDYSIASTLGPQACVD